MRKTLPLGQVVVVELMRGALALWHYDLLFHKTTLYSLEVTSNAVDQHKNTYDRY